MFITDPTTLSWIYAIFLTMLCLPLMRYAPASAHIRKFGLLYLGAGLLLLISMLDSSYAWQMSLYASTALCFVLWGIGFSMPDEQWQLTTALVELGSLMAFFSIFVYSLALLIH